MPSTNDEIHMVTNGSLKFFVFTLTVSAVLFVLFTLFKKRSLYQVSGEIDANNAVRRDATEVNYGTEFALPPKLDFFKSGLVEYEIKEQRATGFVVVVTAASSGSSLRWQATGVPAIATDPRSVWGKFDLRQRIFSIASILATIGLVADLLGIFQFFSKWPAD